MYNILTFFSESKRMYRYIFWFSLQMLKKLNKYKSIKGDSWLSADVLYLYIKCIEEIQELSKAIDEKDKNAIIEEAADVANYAMMIAYRCKRDE